MRNAVVAGYDAVLNTLSKHSSLDYRLVLKLFNESREPLTTSQADTLLDITKKAYCDNPKVYNAYIGYYARHTTPQTVINKFNEHKNAPSLQSSPDMHDIVVHAFHETGDICGMVRVANVLRARNRGLSMTNTECVSLLRHLAHTDLAECERWATYLHDTSTSLDFNLYNELITAFAQAHNIVSLRFLSRMQNAGLTPTEATYAPLLDMANTDKQSRTFDRILSKTRTKEACSALLMLCVRRNYFARAHELYTLRGPQMFSTTALNFLLESYAKQGNVARASALLHDMSACDAVSFEIAANMYARASDARGCRELVSLMRANGASLTPGVILALMDVCVVHGDEKGCVKLFDIVRDRNIATSAVYDKMITLYGNIGELQKARDIWELMVSQGVTPSTNTYNLIIAAHAKQGKSADCTNFFEDMKARQLTPNLGTFAGILAAHVAQRNFQSSRKYFDEMKQAMPNTDGLDAILQYCSEKSAVKNEGLLPSNQLQ